MWTLVADLRDARPRAFDDVSTDELLDALLDNDALVMDFLAQARRGPTA